MTEKALHTRSLRAGDAIFRERLAELASRAHSVWRLPAAIDNLQPQVKKGFG